MDRRATGIQTRVDDDDAAASNTARRSSRRRYTGGSDRLKVPAHLRRPEGASRKNSVQDLYYGHDKHANNDSESSQSGPTPWLLDVHLEELLPAEDLELSSFGLEELRDGYFDAPFHRPLPRRRSQLLHDAAQTLPESFHERHPLSARGFIPRQLREAKTFAQKLLTRSGIKLLKSFVGVFVAYIICLIPAAQQWLGRYSYIMALSALWNHPGRPIGSQLDGAMFTILGTAAGLGWGSLALYVSTSTPIARNGYGGILATFLVIFTASIGLLRCFFIRLYQAVISAGIAICYTTLANTSQVVGWRKVFDYGIPWVLGQAISLVVACTIFPTAGARALAVVTHQSLQSIDKNLVFPRSASYARHEVSLEFTRISTAVRDFAIEFTCSRFDTADARQLRNLLQSVIRSIWTILPDTVLFDHFEEGDLTDSEAMIRHQLAAPTRRLIDAQRDCIAAVDHTINKLAAVKLTPLSRSPVALRFAIRELKAAKKVFDTADARLLEQEDITKAYKDDEVAVELFLFVHPVRQTANQVEALATHVLGMQERNRSWWIQVPSYPWRDALTRSNAQVRHDRGGVTAGFYFKTKDELDKTMMDLLRTAYVPVIDDRSTAGLQHEVPTITASSRARYKLWSFFHALQGFEARFALKVTLLTTLLAVPAWLPQSRQWWNDNDSWWAVVAVWLMTHPRVGGTFNDLFTRCACAAVGATWGGLANRAANRNPYVVAVFAVIFLPLMLYRFSQSSHPRSGMIGCVSFIVVSLQVYNYRGHDTIAKLSWTRGAAFVVGTSAAIVVNWLLWPFVARHELRKSLASMLIYMGVVYRGVIARYIYYAEGEVPTAKDVQKSEILEEKLREGFVRLRQLLVLTRHEIRLRGPFQALPYSALIAACESFFQNLVRVRQASLYFQHTLRPTADAMEALIGPRRDAAAVIMINLYAMSCALRLSRPVPRYLPSAALARKHLIDKLNLIKQRQAELDQLAERAKKGSGEAPSPRMRRWADIYHYAYSVALTDIVHDVQVLQRYTKEICGEAAWS